MKPKLKSILAAALCAVGLAAFAEPVVAQFVKGGKVVAGFATAEAAVAALDDEQYAYIEEFRIGLAADTVFDFGGRTNRVVILNVGEGVNTLKNVLLDGVDGGCAVTGSVGTVVFGDGVRIEKEALDFKRGMVKLIIKGGLYKNVPSAYCEEGYFGALRYDENEKLNGLYAVLPAAEIAVEDPKGIVSTRYATLQDAFNLIKENTDVTLRLFNNLELGKAVTKLEGNKFVHLLPSESGANTITRNGEEPVIEIGREAKLAISNVVFNGANVTSGNPMIEVVGKDKPTVEGKFGWLIACDGFVVSNAVGGAVHVGSGGRFELDGVAKIIDNTTDGKPKNVIIEDKQAIVLVNGGAVTDGNYAQIGVWSGNPKFMIPGGQFGAVDKKYKFAESFADGDISVAEPWVGFINDLDGTLHHAAGAKLAAAPKAGEGKKTYKRWVGGKYKELVEEGDHLISRESTFPMAPTPNCFPELIWTARQEAPAAQPAPAILDWTDTTLTLAVSNGCDYALVKDGSAKTNWVSMVKTDNTYPFARPAGTDYLCLRRYSITTSNIVSAATAYFVRVAAGTEDDPWLVGAENPKDVTAWTNGNEFVVGGTGTVSHLSKLASKVTVEKLTIKDATVTVAASDAFQGFGASGSKVSLTLPDNWQGELPGEGGNWYGALIDMENFVVPLAVKNVTFQQRYPWNGKVDIGFGVTGPVGETNVVVTAYTNGTVKIASYVAAVTIPADGVFATNLVWDASDAGLAANFKSDDVTIEVKIDESDIAAKSEAGALDLTVGDRVAKDVETLVVDPAWDETDPSLAKVFIDGEEEPRQYTVATNDTWETAELEPGRYELEMQTSCSSYPAIFWKLGDDWVVFNSSNVTEGATFEADKTYLMLGTNTVAGTLKVMVGAKFEYGEGAGFVGGTVADPLPKRYEQKTVEGDLYRIVEKIKGCEDNPWEVGEGVEAWTNGTELVVQGAGSVTNLADVVTDWGDIKGGLTAINVTSNGVTGAVSDAFQGVGGGKIALKLPDGWQGELPDEGGNWYGATVDMDNFVYPLTVKNVTFQQRYPWNGKVDIGFGVTGPVGEKNVIITVRDGESEVTNFTAAVTIPAGGLLATNLVWDADAAGLGVDFKRDNITVEVKIAESDIAAKSAAGALDLRDDVPLDEGAVTVSNVTWSATAWGTEPDSESTDIVYVNETTGETIALAADLTDEGMMDIVLPKKDGVYHLAHSTGGLESSMTFVVSGYPLGCETNPWKVGPEEDPERTVAWRDGNGNVYFKPPRSAVSRTGLETVATAMGGVMSFPAKLVSEDGTATNNIVMVLGASGTVYDTIAAALAADEASCTLFEVGGYFVSYSGGEGASGTMATDTFVPTVPTNLTANAYTIVGYRFDGWSTNGTTVAYTNRQEGVDFAQPGETLALTALWTQVGVEPADYDELSNMLAKVTRPLTITLNADIEIPLGGKIVVPEGKSVTFTGDGKFDVSDIVPQFGEPVTVGEGLAEGDLDRFDADGVSKPVFEDGKVVLHARGESADFPWVLDGAKGVTAWVDPALTNLAAVVIDNGLPAATNEIDLVALTNNLAVCGYEPALQPLNALLAVGKDGGAPEYVKPVNWIGAASEPYATLEAALAAGETVVVPNFVTEEIPEEIAETGKGSDGKTYTAVVVNKPAGSVADPIKAIYAEGLIDLATSEKQNVKLEVTPTNVEDVAQQTVTSLTNVLLTALKDQEGHLMRIMETNMVDLSVYYNETKQTTLNSLIAIHIPWTINAEYTYGVSRMHNGVAQAIPEGAANANGDGEYFELGADEIVLRVKNFSDYLIAGTMPLVPRIGASIKWKLCYATGSLFAQLKLAVTNGQASAVENLKFVFEDRADGSKLWGASSDRSQQGAVLTGWTGLPAGTWRYVNVDGDALTAVKGGNTGTFGVQSGIDTANGTVASADRKIELYKKNAVISSDEANQFLGWVVWEAYGEKYCAPVGEGEIAAQVAGEKVGGEQVAGEQPTPRSVPVAASVASGSGTVKYPTANASTGLLKEKANSTWTATADAGSVFAGWIAAEGAPQGVADRLAALSANELRDKKLTIKVGAGEQIRPTDVAATWVRIDADAIRAVGLTPAGLVVDSKSYVTATVSGLPTGLKFDKKTLAITGAAKKSETKTVKVTVKNASGYTWKQSFAVTVSGGAVTDVVAANDCVKTGTPVIVSGDAALGKVTGAKVYVAGKKASIKATPAAGSIFLGWYEDAAFTTPATNLPKGYLTAAQSVVVPAEGLELYARFAKVESWAVGTFDGVFYDGDTNACGTVTFTVSSKGKVSGKVKADGATSSFSAATFDDVREIEGAKVFVAHPTVKVGGETLTLELAIGESDVSGLGYAEISFGEEADAPFAMAVQNGWKLKPAPLPSFPTGKKALSFDTPEGLKITFAAKGVAKVSGKVAGVSVSATTQVLPVAWRSTMTPNLLTRVCVYVPPNRGFDGFCAVYDVVFEVGEGDAFVRVIK